MLITKRKRFSGVEGRTRGTPSTPAHLHICLLLGNTGRTASGMFIQFDLVFRKVLVAKIGPFQKPRETPENRSPLVCASPPQFRGKAGNWTTHANRGEKCPTYQIIKVREHQLSSDK